MPDHDDRAKRDLVLISRNFRDDTHATEPPAVTVISRGMASLNVAPGNSAFGHCSPKSPTMDFPIVAIAR
jgi:hypothetical protein